MSKRKMWVSISGGRTSAYMAIKLKENYSDRYDFIYVYANTGLEHEETLRFLDRIDKEHNLSVVWLEAVINKEWGKGGTHKIVDFETAQRGTGIFEDMIDAYGIPNVKYPHCTRELKLVPMTSYIKSIGWQDEFRAIGLRYDEPRRWPAKASKERKLYPLIDFFETTKEQVLDYFRDKNLDLKLPEHMGNCVTCWKKSDVKLARISKEHVGVFDFFDRMEKEKGTCGHNIDGTPRTFFRQNRSVSDIRALGDLIPLENIEMMDRCATEECDAG